MHPATDNASCCKRCRKRNKADKRLRTLTEYIVDNAIQEVRVFKTLIDNRGLFAIRQFPALTTALVSLRFEGLHMGLVCAGGLGVRLRLDRYCKHCGAGPPGSNRVTLPETSARCGACRQVWYCGPACQMEDWPEHKTECDEHGKDYLLAKNCPGIGRGIYRHQ